MTWLENRIPPLLIVALFGLAMAYCAGMFGMVSVHFTGQHWVALALLALGFAVVMAAVVQFRRARTTVDPRHPEAASTLVRGGIFGFSRNPMYLGMALALASWAVFLGNALALLLVAGFVAWINRFQITPEERALRARFGSEFDRYAGQVRRWI
ncbi:MAG: isoprenylcysteine carboxylmethyltransferase family protein [Proteobacteria bacterium]|nr:MAG: isoprenylcysteine carboxylmethyltransferase family protein [Pseudomonadota bacterium]